MGDAVATIARLRRAQQRIAWIESHPAFSEWVKRSLASAVERDPTDVINDLEILTHVLRAWATASLDVTTSLHDTALDGGAIKEA